MTLLLVSTIEIPEAWQRQMATVDDSIEIRFWPDIGRPEDIVMTALDLIPDGLLPSLPNLKCVQFLGHGAADVLKHPELPPGVVVSRLRDSGIIRWVAEHVVAYILRRRRHIDTYAAQQKEGRWQRHPVPDAPDTCVAVLGLGSIGTRIATTLAGFEFRVLGWATSPHAIDGVDCRHGADSLAGVLEAADFIVSILPGTAEMHNFFDADVFALMKENAYFINVGRGSLVDEAAIIEALDDGLFAGAALDVFHTEPLPADSPVWHHPKITVTPHAAGGPATTSIVDIAENYRRVVAGEEVLNIAAPDKGY